MTYYTGMGDYYSGKGDPGLRSLLGGVIKTVGSAVGAVVPGVGAVSRAVGAIVSGPSRAVAAPRAMTQPSAQGFPRLPTTTFGPALPTISQPPRGGKVPGACGGGGNPCGSGWHLDKARGVKCVRNRRVNYTNPQALSRAAKRMDGFVGVARKALKSTNYKVVAKSYKANYRKPLKR